MKIEIYARYKNEDGKFISINRAMETNLTIPQLRRISRKRNLFVRQGCVTIVASCSGDTKAHVERWVDVISDTLNFARVTGLTPSDAGRKTWNLRHNRKGMSFRSFDHDLVWRTPSKAIVYTNEPYDIEGFVEWVAQTGWQHRILDKTHSFYYPGSTFLVITSDDPSVDVAAIADAWAAR